MSNFTGFVMGIQLFLCPIAMVFHSNRRSEDLFGGGQDVFHELFYDLLLNGAIVDGLSAQDMGDGSHDHRKPVMGLAGSYGNQDEKQCEGSHDRSPYLDWLNTSKGRT